MLLTQYLILNSVEGVQSIFTSCCNNDWFNTARYDFAQVLQYDISIKS